MNEKSEDTDFDIENFKEGAKEFTRQFIRLLEKTEKRRSELVDMIIPQLSPETKRKIVNDYDEVDYLKFDDDKLRHHLEALIIDFDANLHWLEKSEISVLSGIINQKPLVSFSSPD